MERTVHLHGTLGKQFGFTPIVVNADNLRTIFIGLKSILGPKFKETVSKGQYRIFKGKTKNYDVSTEEIEFNLGKTKEVHVWPVISGASAGVRIVIGIALLAVGVFFPPAGLLATQIIVGTGASLILGGVMELLAPKPKLTKPSVQAGQNPSFIFNGTVNVTEQGGPVPVVLGRVRRASSVVLSAGLTTENLPV